MGTHISRVKSVDLDSWTDEQLQSMLRWGNSRANKYWEAKLAPGHVPAEAKIENFIRTKYDSKRWVMDGPMPDPATLDVNGDDDVPLQVVQEKVKLERSSSQRAAASNPLPRIPQARQNVDLFGDESASSLPRPSTTEPTISRPTPPRGPPPPPKQTKPGDSLLGLDFFGSSQSPPPARPASATSGLGTASGAPPRTDLKQSILSLYSSAPRSAPTQAQKSSAISTDGPTSSTIQSPPQSSLGDMNDAFSSLSFTSTSSASQQTPKPAPFAGLTSQTAQQPSTSSSTFGSGGGFFNTTAKAASKVTSPPAKPAVRRQSSGFGDFGDFTSSYTSSTDTKPPPPASSTMGDLFDMPTPTAQAATKPMPPIQNDSYSTNSAFNLSKPAAPPPKPSVASASTFNASFSSMDAWGSNDAWSTPDPAPAPMQASTSTIKAPPTVLATTSADFGGWSAGTASVAKPNEPTITQDDDFGGWSHASPVPATTQASGSKGFGGSDDLFSNVWE
ncbi:ARF GAP with effector function(s) [Elasticomyces elasticus]|nr:ARF GAP with effector function(s) [Elasticomyces elasticus]